MTAGAEYMHLLPGATIPSLRQARPFKAVIVSETVADEGWRTRVCRELVRAGCLYAMAWGRDCQLWHDCVDEVRYNPAPDEGDDFLIMTTWHDNEPLEETFWFAAMAANHPTRSLDHTLLVHISPLPNKEAILRAFAEAQGASS